MRSFSNDYLGCRGFSWGFSKGYLKDAEDFLGASVDRKGRSGVLLYW
jgi:hypothetical protein